MAAGGRDLGEGFEPAGAREKLPRLVGDGLGEAAPGEDLAGLVAFGVGPPFSVDLSGFSRRLTKVLTEARTAAPFAFGLAEVAHASCSASQASSGRAANSRMAKAERSGRRPWNARPRCSKLTTVTARQTLVQQLADLSDEDVQALLPIVERLRAKRIVPANARTMNETTSLAPSPRRHPERFGPLTGTVRFVGEIEAPVENADGWTFDAENLKP